MFYSVTLSVKKKKKKSLKFYLFTSGSIQTFSQSFFLKKH